MQINVSLPKILSLAAPIIRVLAVIMVILAFISLASSPTSFIAYLVNAFLLLIVSLLCDCVVELYAKIEELTVSKSEK